MNSETAVTHPASGLGPSGHLSGDVNQVLVLGGGGVRGAFQAGAIQALFRRGFLPDAVYGTSVGALNAAFLVDRAARYGSEAIDWRAISDELVTFWLTELDRPDKLWKMRNKLWLLISVVCNRFESVLDVSGWRAIIERSLSEDNISRVSNRVRLKINAVDVDTQNTFYAENSTPDLKRHIIASASVPFLMPLVKKGETAYCDGGTRHVVLLRQAVRDGAKKIVCVVCHPERQNVKPVSDLGNFFKLLERFADISTTQILEDDLELVDANSASIEKSGVCLVRSLEAQTAPVRPWLIRPSASLDVDALSYTHADVQKLIDAGFLEASRTELPC
jgi:NTE family protein